MPEKFDPEGSGYDYETAIAGGGRPDPVTKHWSSRDPVSGQMLMGRSHPTWNLAAEGELAAGYRVSKGENGKYYSAPEEDDELRRRELEIWKQRMVGPEENIPVEQREGIYQGIVERLMAEHPGLRSLPTKVIMGLMWRESQFLRHAKGSAGEVGLMQIKPDVAQETMERRRLGSIENLYDPRENILAGMSYLRTLQGMFGGLEKAVEAYNRRLHRPHPRRECAAARYRALPMNRSW